MGPYGHHLADSIFMHSPAAPSHSAAGASGHEEQALPPLLMEFFPPGTFVRDQQYAMQALGIDYMAWWKEMCVDSIDSLQTQTS